MRIVTVNSEQEALDYAPHFALNDRASQGKQDRFHGNDRPPGRPGG